MWEMIHWALSIGKGCGGDIYLQHGTNGGTGVNPGDNLLPSLLNI